MRLLLDTSVLIDVLRMRRGRSELLAKLVREGHLLATSSLNIAEIYAGMRASEAAATEKFLGHLDCYDLTRAIGRTAGQLKSQWGRRGRTLTLADTLVAAVALEHDCVLMSDNTRDFPMAGLKLYALPPE
jgi:predicted nucleic acid-binding protein